MSIHHVIRQGESVAQLAHAFGFFPDTIWNHPDNAELKARRGHMNILLPGDVVVIPDKEPKSVFVATGSRHVFRRRGVPAILRLQVKHHGEPRVQQDYRLTVDGAVYEGTTDGEGMIRQFVDPSATRAQLVIGPDAFAVTLRIGHMDPISVPAGVRKRLRNLGYEPRDEGASLAAAIAAFQSANGLEVTGEANDAIRTRLEQLHDHV